MSVQGKLTVYYGCMFAGKTSALIDYLSQGGLKRNEFLVLKPAIDIRSGNRTITTHDGRSHECLIVDRDTDINELITPFIKLIAIDEAQFFDKMFFSDIKRFLAKGIDIVATGLDRDYLGRPFGLMPMLQTIATEKNHLKASCNQCGKEAEYTYRKIDNKVLLLIGSEDYYEARCESCYTMGRATQV
jgi:thymidine kinase